MLLLPQGLQPFFVNQFKVTPVIELRARLDRRTDRDLSSAGVDNRSALETRARIGFDFNRGRLDLCSNAFCTNLSMDDVRMTTRGKDHLNGVLFLDRMSDMKSLAFVDEWQEFLHDAADDGPRSKAE